MFKPIMFKSIFASLTALSIAAAPVQAGGLTEEDLGKILFGLAALAVVGKLVEDHGAPSVTAPQNRPRDLQQTTRYDPRVLPRDCLRGYETRFGTHRMFGERCLRKSYRFAAQLPDACSVRIFTNDGPRRGFDPQCLRNRGYTARR